MTGAIEVLGSALDVQRTTAEGLYQNVSPSQSQAPQGGTATLMSGPDTVQISEQGLAALNSGIPGSDE